MLRLLKLVPEYGRWDDLIDFYFADLRPNVRNAVFNVIRDQFESDLKNAGAGKPISLLAKWLPSLTTSSVETKKRAERIRAAFGYSPRTYRKKLSALRDYLNVTETRMSANKWQDIDYEKVPSRAAMNYRDAFDRHDQERYRKYLDDIKSGAAKINAGVLFPHDIVHTYYDGYMLEATDDTLEAQWKALPGLPNPDSRTLVVVDGSGSMGARIGRTSLSCEEVAQALGIYFAERLTGAFADHFITFSAHPQMVRLEHSLSLHDKLDLLSAYDECSNTNIEATFDLILKTAVQNGLTQEDLPTNVLIITDCEFDTQTSAYNPNTHKYECPDKKLFDAIADKFARFGYKLPRLVFWNICSRTGTIPLAENDFGVALVSGFSPSIADMVMSGKLDPFECLRDKLMSDRYKPVLDALKE